MGVSFALLELQMWTAVFTIVYLWCLRQQNPDVYDMHLRDVQGEIAYQLEKLRQLFK
jgi:hypothetical protein